MARNESDREDLLQEAVAMVRRMELHTPGQTDPIVVGFRANGWMSVYFGQDRMYQFDEVGRLRRAYVDGFLYRSHGTVLARLQRERTETETTLLRQDLTPDALGQFQQQCRTWLRSLRNQLEVGFTVQRQIPVSDEALPDDVARFLDTVLESEQFLAPAIKR